MTLYIIPSIHLMWVIHHCLIERYLFSWQKTLLQVSFSQVLWGVWFYTYRAVLADSSHRCMEISWSWSISLAASMIVLLFLSTTPLHCGLYGVVNSLLIPEYLHNSLNSFDVNSPPLSNRNVLILFYVWFLIKALNSLTLE